MDTLPLWAWVGFLLFIAAMLAIDLGVFRRGAHAVRMKEALAWCAVWFSLAMGFNLVVWRTLGGPAGLEWLTGYLVEISLSVDNVFVFIVIFSYFRVAPAHQHRVLFWGIVGAAVMRMVFILAGVSLLQRFEWLIYLFGAFLIFTGIKLARPHKDDFDPEKNIVVRLFRRFFPVSSRNDEGHFFTRIDGRLMATPLFIVLIVIETTDVAFALDSIPAVLAITKNPFIVFTSNVFAILGLRSLYFAVHGIMGLFRFLALGLAFILVFVGVKMLISGYYHIPIGVSLGVIGLTLAVSIGASVLIAKKEADPH
jgi:tellurite resistance protein TerC